MASNFFASPDRIVASLCGPCGVESRNATESSTGRSGAFFRMRLLRTAIFFRFFRQVLPAANGDKARRVLIYGAGDAGELLLRELLNNRDLGYAPVGFMDDDPKKQGKVIHGFRVFGGNGLLKRVVRQQQVEQVLISSPRISEQRIAEIWSECEAQNIELKRMSIRIENISEYPSTHLPRPSANGNS